MISLHDLLECRQLYIDIATFVKLLLPSLNHIDGVMDNMCVIVW
jgi:hypothetical protein